MQLYIYDILFTSFIKTLLLSLLCHVHETMCEIRRSTDHHAKTKHFYFARDNYLMSPKTEVSNVAKTESLMSQKSEVFNVTKTNFFNIGKSVTYLDVTEIKFYNVPETELFNIAETEYLMSQKTYDTQYRWSSYHISNT